MKVKLLPWQYQVASDPHRFRVVNAGRRAGKSVLSRMWTLKLATEKQGLYWIVSPTYPMGKEIHWKQGLNNEIPADWIVKKNESDLEVVLKNGSRIALRSAEHPERLKGVKLSGLVVDEIAMMRNWDEIWQEALRPTLTDYEAPALFISTPRGYNHFFSLWEKGQKPSKVWKSWKFTTYANTHLPAGEIEKAKAELDEDTFAQEYLAEFRKYTGLVYKDFSREETVIEPLEIPNDWVFYRGIDFGWTHPTAVVFLAISPEGKVYLYDEIYERQLKTPDLAEMIKQRSGGRLFSGTFADSAQAAQIAELNSYGISVVSVSKTSKTNEESWASYKIKRVAELLRGKKLFVLSNCENTIFEFENYVYCETRKDGQVTEKPMKVNDHLMDALAYAVCSIPRRIEPEFEDNFEPIPKPKLFDKDGFY